VRVCGPFGPHRSALIPCFSTALIVVCDVCVCLMVVVSCLASLTQICFLRLAANSVTILQLYGCVSTAITCTDRTNDSRFTDQSQCKALESRAGSLRGLTLDICLLHRLVHKDTDIHNTYITARHIDMAHSQATFPPMRL
jgi:hypothetical protein